MKLEGIEAKLDLAEDRTLENCIADYKTILKQTFPDIEKAIQDARVVSSCVGVSQMIPLGSLGVVQLLACSDGSLVIVPVHFGPPSEAPLGYAYTYKEIDS